MFFYYLFSLKSLRGYYGPNRINKKSTFKIEVSIHKGNLREGEEKSLRLKLMTPTQRFMREHNK